ncbi:MAG: hypothetical protein WCR52_08515 [Bacteroidota bacterium]
MEQFRSGNSMNNKNTHFKNDANPPDQSSFPDETLRRELNRMRHVQKSIQAAKRDHTGNSNYAIFGAFILCTLAVVFYQFWPTTDNTPMAKNDLPKTSPQVVYPASPKATDSNPIANSINPVAKPKAETEKQTARAVRAEDIKAFKPNPFLEELAGSMKSSNVVVTPQAPKPDAVYASQNCAVQIPFEGTVSGMHEKNLNLSVYSNQTENFQDKPLFEEPLLLEKTGVSHKYAIKAMLKLRPGLYYFVIENKKDETVAVGKFKVG